MVFFPFYFLWCSNSCFNFGLFISFLMSKRKAIQHSSKWRLLQSTGKEDERNGESSSHAWWMDEIAPSCVQGLDEKWRILYSQLFIYTLCLNEITLICSLSDRKLYSELHVCSHSCLKIIFSNVLGKWMNGELIGVVLVMYLFNWKDNGFMRNTFFNDNLFLKD